MSIPRPSSMSPVSSMSPAAATLAIAATGVAYGSATFFARRLAEAGLSPVTIAFSRFALVAAVLAPWLRLGRGRRRATTWGLASGAAMALGWIAYADGIGRGDVALAGVAYMTYPLFTLATLTVVFRHRLGVRQIIGGVAVLGAAAMALAAGADGGGLALTTFLAPATFGFSTAVLTERLTSLAPAERLSAVAVGASVALVPFVLALPVDEARPSGAAAWASVVGLGVGAALVPMFVYSAVAPVIGAARSSVAGATELPTVLLVGGLVFGEALTPRHGVAVLLILVAILVTPVTRSTHVLPDDDDTTLPGLPEIASAGTAAPVR